MPAITGTVLVNLGKQLLKNMAKKAVKATAKKAVKSVVKKKKVKGKDVAKKMFGGEEKGGALALAPKADLVPSPGGDLVKPKETGGEIVKVSGTAAKDLGLNSFMESLSKIQTNVDAIKVAINDNNKDTIDRIEDQRILNAKLAKEAREDELESKGGGIGKKLLKPIKDPADDFLTRMAKFATMTLLGTLIVALMNGSRDIILAFRIGIEAIKKGLPTLLKGVKALKSGIGKAFKLALRPFKSLGNLVSKGFKALGNKVFGMVKGAMGLIDDALKAIIRAGANAFPRVASVATKVTQTAGKLINQGKEVVKNTIKNVGSKAKNVIKNVGGKASKFITKLFGKQAGKAAGSTVVKSMFKTLGKAAKGIKIPVVGPLLVALMSMFAGDPMKQTLFKTAGAAIGGGLGLALGPIGMIVGEIAGEFVGDVLYTGFSGEAGGWKAAGKKLKDKFMQILSGGKKVGKWLLNSIKRIGWGGLGTLLNPLAGPKKKFNVLKEGFFPPAEMTASEPNTDADSVSSSASYEDGGEGATVVVDAGGGESSAPSPSASKSKIINLPMDKQTIVNSQYEMLLKSKTFKS